MKQLKYLLPALLLAITSITSCYKDKGNYEYAPFGDVGVKFYPSGTFNAVIGDEFQLNATVISKSSGDSLRFFDETKYEYEWYLDGRVIGTDKNFKGICALPTGQSTGIYLVIDKETGERTQTRFVVNVSSSINVGWMILANKGGKSDLTYVKWQNPNAQPHVFRAYLNAYPLFNEGEELGTDPIKMVEHYAIMSGESEVLIIQGGGQGAIEISGKTLKKVINLEKEFIGEKYPPGFKLKDAYYFGGIDFLLDENGAVYSRASVDPGAYTPFYIQHDKLYPTMPVTVEGGWKVDNFLGSDFNGGVLLFYDAQRNRYHATVNSYYEGDIYPFISSAIDPAAFPHGFTPVHNYGTTVPVYSLMNGAYPRTVKSILKTAEGKYRYQTFLPNHSPWTYNVTCIPVSEKPIFIDAYVTSKTMYQILYLRNYFLFTGGANNDKIYYYNLDTDVVGLYHDFQGKSIKQMKMNISLGNARNRNDVLAVALNDGSFIVYDVATPVLTGGNSVELYRLEDMGDIVDIIFKAYNYSSTLL